MYCSQCGKELEFYSRFCKHCGAEVFKEDSQSHKNNHSEELASPIVKPNNQQRLNEKKQGRKPYFILGLCAITAIVILIVVLNVNKKNYIVGTGLRYTTIEDHSILDYYLQQRYGNNALSDYFYYDYNIDNELSFILAQRISEDNSEEEYSICLLEADPELWYSWEPHLHPTVLTSTAEVLETIELGHRDFEIRKAVFDAPKMHTGAVTLYFSILKDDKAGIEKGLIQSIFVPWDGDEHYGSICTYNYDTVMDKIMITSSTYQLYAELENPIDALLNYDYKQDGIDGYRTEYIFDDLCNIQDASIMSFNTSDATDMFVESSLHYQYEDGECTQVTVSSAYWGDVEYYYSRNIQGFLANITQIEYQKDDEEVFSKTIKDIEVEYNSDGHASYICLGADTDYSFAEESSTQNEEADSQQANEASSPQDYYNDAEEAVQRGDIIQAAILYGKAGDYQDAWGKSKEYWEKIAPPSTIVLTSVVSAAINESGEIMAVGSDNWTKEIVEWKDIYSLEGELSGIKTDGTVISSRYNVAELEGIVALSDGGNDLLALKADGTVALISLLETADLLKEQRSVSEWTDIIAVAAGRSSMAALRADGTVVAVGANDYGQCDVSNWKDIKSISVGGLHTVGLKTDGTVVATGANSSGECEVSSWTDIIAIATGDSFTAGLKTDGTVVATGDNSRGQCDVGDWSQIVAITTSSYEIMGLCSDGTAIAIGDDYYGQCDVDGWSSIKIPNN